MKLVFLKSFSKDLDTLKNKSAKIALTKNHRADGIGGNLGGNSEYKKIERP